MGAGQGIGYYCRCCGLNVRGPMCLKKHRPQLFLKIRVCKTTMTVVTVFKEVTYETSQQKLHLDRIAGLITTKK